MLESVGHNISTSLLPPNKRRRVGDQESPRTPPSVKEEPHSSPGKLSELGLHVFLSPKNRATSDEGPSSQMTSSVAITSLSPPGEVKKSRLEQQRKTGEEPLSDRRHENIYVKAFNTAVDTVLEREGHLFSPEEMSIINLYRTLPCESPP